MVSYGMNPVDLFEANDLFESGNMTQVQVSLLALAGKVRPRWAATWPEGWSQGVKGADKHGSLQPGKVVHAFNPSVGETEAGESL